MAGALKRGKREGPKLPAQAILLAGLLCMLSACAVHLPRATPYEDLQLVATEPEEAWLLDVAIAEFDYLPDEAGPEGEGLTLAAVRAAESRYMPVMLQYTLTASGSWGEVNVLPELDGSYDVQLQATILESSGHTLALQVSVRDATGRQWFDRRYTEHVGDNVFGAQSLGVNDPFQGIYNRIANDLLAFRQTRDTGQLRQVALMRFGSRIAPEAYGDYLAVDRRGIAALERLPAPDDPVHARMQQIRLRDRAFHGALQTRYFDYVRSISDNYLQYRRLAFLEVRQQHEQQGEARSNLLSGLFWLGVASATADYDTVLGSTVTALAVLEGIGDLQAGIAGLPVDNGVLAELSESFGNDVSEEVVQLEHDVVVLEGNVESLYRQWQDILQQMFREDRGVVTEGASGNGT